MRKKGYKGRVEKRVLGKCEGVCRTYDAIQTAYADVLQQCSDVQLGYNADEVYLYATVQ